MQLQYLESCLFLKYTAHIAFNQRAIARSAQWDCTLLGHTSLDEQGGAGRLQTSGSRHYSVHLGAPDEMALLGRTTRQVAIGLAPRCTGSPPPRATASGGGEGMD